MNRDLKIFVLLDIFSCFVLLMFVAFVLNTVYFSIMQGFVKYL